MLKAIKEGQAETHSIDRSRVFSTAVMEEPGINTQLSGTPFFFRTDEAVGVTFKLILGVKSKMSPQKVGVLLQQKQTYLSFCEPFWSKWVCFGFHHFVLRPNWTPKKPSMPSLCFKLRELSLTYLIRWWFLRFGSFLLQTGRLWRGSFWTSHRLHVC